MIYRKLYSIINKYKSKIHELRRHKNYDYTEYHRLRIFITQFEKLLGSKKKNDIIDEEISKIKGVLNKTGPNVKHKHHKSSFN